MGGELVEPSPLPSYTEVFYEQFPFYLSIGMTYDQYWNDDCLLVEYYRKAYEMKRNRKNEELWLQGMYIYEALCDVAPVLHAFAKSGTKPNPYSERPYALTKKEANARKEEQEKANRERAKAIFEIWANNLNLPERKDVSVSDDN